MVIARPLRYIDSVCTMLERLWGDASRRGGGRAKVELSFIYYVSYMVCKGCPLTAYFVHVWSLTILFSTHCCDIWCAAPVFSMTSTTRLDAAVRTAPRSTARTCMGPPHGYQFIIFALFSLYIRSELSGHLPYGRGTIEHLNKRTT